MWTSLQVRVLVRRQRNNKKQAEKEGKQDIQE